IRNGELAGGIDQSADAQAEPDHEQHRKHERGQHAAAPGAQIANEVELEDRQGRLRNDAHYSTKLRPVRCRKTSSSELRRTSTADGCRPRPVASAKASSPSSA